jgi:hypothetical protein
VIDPSINLPTHTNMVKIRNLINKRMEWTRISVESGSYIPIPAKFDAWKDQKAGEMDTDAKLVNEVTWTPNLLECPFPTPVCESF